jgi:[citrate (pro-3S)-lyase] ligase
MTKLVFNELQTKEFKGYSVKTVDNILKLRNDVEKCAKFLTFLEMLDIKTIGVIAEDEMLVFFGEILSKRFKVNMYKSFDDLKNEDLVLLQNFYATETMNLKFSGRFVFDCEKLFLIYDQAIYFVEKINKLGLLTDKLFLFRIPAVYGIKNPSLHELKYKHEVQMLEVIIRGLNLVVTDKEEYEKEVIYTPEVIERRKNLCWCDFKGKYANYISGRRITTDSVMEYKNKIFVLGNSVAYGRGSEDKNTIPSVMQRILNTSEVPYEVVTCGVPEAISLYNVIEEAKKGDKIIIIVGGYIGDVVSKVFSASSNIEIISLNYLFDRPHDLGEVYYDIFHLNYVGNERVAKEIIKLLQGSNNVGIVKCDGTDILVKDNCKEIMEMGLKEYIDEIEKLKVDVKNVGAVIMTCNPFTYGHRHLIECAAKHVDHLYVFVVEEDRFYFSSEDRYALVKAGTKDMPNVTVLQSGSILVSTVTFPEYFNRDNLHEVTVNPALDIEIFAKYIAPVLNITKRFVGNEPICHVTNQYNNIMREVLTKYSIEFVEFKRKEAGGKPISASRVRKLIAERDAQGIKELVPPTTYDFIITKYVNQ